MNISPFELIALTVLGLILFFLSLLEHAVNGVSRLSLRVLCEKVRHPRNDLLRRVADDRRHFLIPIQLGIQFTTLILAVLTTTLCLEQGIEAAPYWALGFLVLVVFLFRQLLPRTLTRFDPEAALLRILPVSRIPYRVLGWFAWPVLWILHHFDPARQRNQLAADEEDEATEEEIQAYLGVGEEEGIFEEEESRLIQSALEFGNTLAREIMTPRTEIVAIEEGATISELRDLIVSSKHSRIPVYRDSLDQIIGIVYVRNLLSFLDQGQGDQLITPLINEALFVPETKRVAELLKEMQINAEHMAVIISEYGAVAGLVTIEDLLEEIVGEIRDEDELHQTDLVNEGNGNYLVRGNVEIDELEEALDIDLGERDVTTVSGLVVDYLGKVPVSGEKFSLHGLGVEILSADRKKIHNMRIHVENAFLTDHDPDSSKAPTAAGT